MATQPPYLMSHLISCRDVAVDIFRVSVGVMLSRELLIVLNYIVSTNCLRSSLPPQNQVQNAGRIVSVRLQLLLHLVVQVFTFTYACDDQLSCSLHTPKMGAVVETWHSLTY